MRQKSRSGGPAIFISYRRSDGDGEAGRLRDRLANRWGASTVFLDTESVNAGTEWPDEIRQALSTSSVMIAVIGPRWCNIVDDQGLPRLGAPGDWVRAELAYAIRHHIKVIPVLVSGAKLPDERDLPEDVVKLRSSQSIELRHSRFDADVRALIVAIENAILGKYNNRRTRLRVLAIRVIIAS